MNVSIRTAGFEVVSANGEHANDEVWDRVGGAIQQMMADAVLDAIRNLENVEVHADGLEVTFGVARTIISEETYIAQ
jgi:hypothetical protein